MDAKVILNTGVLSRANAEAFTKALDEQVQNHPQANAERISHVLFSYYVMKEISKANKGVKVTYELGSPSKNMGVVSVVGKAMSFKDSKLFMGVVGLATNFEVYPKTDGTVRMNFTFHGLEKKDGEKDGI